MGENKLRTDNLLVERDSTLDAARSSVLPTEVDREEDPSESKSEVPRDSGVPNFEISTADTDISAGNLRAAEISDGGEEDMSLISVCIFSSI